MDAHVGFRDARTPIQQRLFRDPSFRATDAMDEMVTITDRYVADLVDVSAATTVWTSGSLGRREMLPYSDLDLFFFSLTPEETPRPVFQGFDHTEIAVLTTADLTKMSRNTLLDLNQIIDGRPVILGELDDEVTGILETANTVDRQSANLITEYCFFRSFDFVRKRSIHGPDVKYSSGSSRMLLFTNFFSRLTGNALPARRTDGAEFLAGMEAATALLGIAPPIEDVDLILVIKNAAFSAFLETRDPRLRYVGPPALSAAFARCEPRLRALGMRNAADLVREYGSARAHLEDYIHRLVAGALARHRSAAVLDEIRVAPAASRTALGIHLADENPQDEATILACAAWSVCLDAPTAEGVAGLAAALLGRDAGRISGAMTAIACSPVVLDSTLGEVLHWAQQEDAGPYIPKIIGRRGDVSARIRLEALRVWSALEFVSFSDQCA